MDAQTKAQAAAIKQLRADIAKERETIRREFATATVGGIKAGLAKQATAIDARLAALAARLDEIEARISAGYVFDIARDSATNLMTQVIARPIE